MKYQSNNYDYDVLVIGAGPAGLSVASEISKKYKVIVIEKNEVIGNTNRSWFVPFDVGFKHKELENYMYNGVSHYYANTYSGAKIDWEAEQYKDSLSKEKPSQYPYVKDDILMYWKKIVEKNDSVLIDNCLYLGHENKKDHVNIRTSKGIYKCRLLIDASGYNSPVWKKYEMKHNCYWWSCFGYIYEYEKDDNLKIGDYMLWETFKNTNLNLDESLRKGRPVLEYEVLDENKVFVLILFLTKEKKEYIEMKEVYNYIIKSEAKLEKFNKMKEIKAKYGWYPSGDVPPEISKDRVTFVGDAALWPTPCGWGMGAILENYKEFSKEILNLLDKETLDRYSLNSIINISFKRKYRIYFNRIASHFLANGTASDMDKFIELFKKDVPYIACERIFTLNQTYNDLKIFSQKMLTTINIFKLIKVIPFSDIIVLFKDIFLLILSIITSIFYKDDISYQKNSFLYYDNKKSLLKKIINFRNFKFLIMSVFLFPVERKTCCIKNNIKRLFSI